MAPGRRAINQLLLSVLIGTHYEHKCTSNGHSSCDIQFKVQGVCLYTCLGYVSTVEMRRKMVGFVEFLNKSLMTQSLHLTQRRVNMCPLNCVGNSAPCGGLAALHYTAGE